MMHLVLLQETTDMLETGKHESLKKGFLDFRKLKDVNFETHNEGAVIRYADKSKKLSGPCRAIQ